MTDRVACGGSVDGSYGGAPDESSGAPPGGSPGDSPAAVQSDPQGKPTSAVIRCPRREEADRIAAVHVETWKETYTELLPDGFFTEEHSRMRREMWARILAEERVEWSIRVAEDDGEIIGLAMAGPVQDAEESSAPAPAPAAAPAPAPAPAPESVPERVPAPVPAPEHGDGSPPASLPTPPAPPAPPARELYMLYVLRSHHGTGAGQALLDATIGPVARPGWPQGGVAASSPEPALDPASDQGPAPEPERGPEPEPEPAPEQVPDQEQVPVGLWVAKQNLRAISFYRRNGFRPDGAEKRDPGAPAITDVRMVRP